MLGIIYISKDINKVLEKLKQKYRDAKIFQRDEFKIDDVKEVIKEAYIAEDHQKEIILSASNFNTFAQNSLLKILEEPPKNIHFIIITPSKNIFLPTILSRLSIKQIKSQKEKIELGLNLKKLGLNDIFEFCKKHTYSSKNDLKEIIEEILKEAVKDGVKFSDKELENFKKSLILASLNSRGYYILTNLLLIIYNKRG